MPKPIYTAALTLLAACIAIGWQVGMAELKNVEFHSDLRDIAAEGGVNIGLNSPKTEDEIRAEIINTAAGYDLQVRPDQVKLERIMYGPHNIYVRYNLAVKYTVRLNLLFSSFNLYFAQTIAK